ncbi:MAG: ABC transporter ATP-binding protein [Pseudomonadota bacterium]
MTDDKAVNAPSLSKLLVFCKAILGPEKDFYILAAIYGVGISLLSLALPISVQMLINTVANTALVAPLTVLSITLFVLLLVSGLLNALRIHLMEIFGRRFYARMTSEIALRAIYAVNPFFTDTGKGPLFNRYFDMVIIQKTIPNLMIGGFTLVLQALVGFVLVSLYHPLFLAFNVIFILLIWAVLAIWGPGAISSAVALSHKKHEAAAWLEALAASNGYYKSQRHIAYALEQTDEQTGHYINEHRRHFRQHFAQTIALLIIYAAASAMLLGLGGWLVIQGQLTLGQLVAAELILSAVFLGVSQFGGYLTEIYDTFAAVEELSQFYDVPQEEPLDAHKLQRGNAELSFLNVRGDARGRDAVFNFQIPSGAKLIGKSTDHGLQRLFANLLRRHVEPEAGLITFGGSDISSIEVHELRQQVAIVDRPTLNEMPIREYLWLSCQDASPANIQIIIRLVGLEPVIANLEDGLDTVVATTGWPLSVTEAMQLKLAAAILSRPQMIVLNQLIDLIPERHIQAVFAALSENKDQTIVYFSNRNAPLNVDGYLYLDYDRQHIFSDRQEFLQSAALIEDHAETQQIRFEPTTSE